MSFASDKLYKGYLLPKMSTIVTTVKVREIVIHLPCLTDHDRENIEAKRETCGNYDSMVLLLDCLKRRENWPEQFIQALEACEHRTLAAGIREEYNALRGINNPNPSSPPATVIRAHVHPAPSASHPSVPKSGGNSQAAVAPPAEAPAPPEPAAQASPPLGTPVQPQAPQSSAAQVPEAVSPPEPVAEATQVEVAPLPSTPPPSPATPHTQAATTPPPQREVSSRREPVENSESDIQGVSVGSVDGVIPDPVSAGNADCQPPRPVEQCETDAPSRPDPLQTATTSTTVARPPQSPSATQINLDVTDGSSFPVMTPEKPPVQDTTPPMDNKPAAVQQPEEMSEPPAIQLVERSPQTEAAATASPLPPSGAAGMDACLFDDNTLCLSKPGQLISIHPQNHSSPTMPAPESPVEPYSGNSERLEISDAAVTSAHVPECSAVSSATVNTASALPCQENGITLSHNEPEENHYDSPCQSLGQVVRENVVHISEEASILNQSSPPQARFVNGEAAREITSAPLLSTSAADTVSSVNTGGSENYRPSEPAPADVSPELKTLQEEESASRTLPVNTKYILTAAAVGACALLMAWKFKN